MVSKQSLLKDLEKKRKELTRTRHPIERAILQRQIAKLERNLRSLAIQEEWWRWVTSHAPYRKPESLEESFG